MKKLFLLLIMAGFAVGAYAQATATASASATVVTPITISKTVDMSFGNVAVKADAGGTVILNTSDGTTTTGNVTLPATAGTITSASFTVNGESGYTYAITLPTTVQVSKDADNMQLSDFTSLPSGTGTLTGGTETVKVGATLTVAAGQASGTYSAGSFDVTVNYN